MHAISVTTIAQINLIQILHEYRKINYLYSPNSLAAMQSLRKLKIKTLDNQTYSLDVDPQVTTTISAAESKVLLDYNQRSEI